MKKADYLNMADTVAKDRSGSVISVYHGSKHRFDRFELSKISDYAHFGGGFYFAVNRKEALTHAEGDSTRSHKGFLYEAEVNLRNPYKTMSNLLCRSDFEGLDARQIRRKLIRQGYDGVMHIYWDGGLYDDSVIVAFYPEQIHIKKVEEVIA